jgi:hypothetical protein
MRLLLSFHDGCAQSFGYWNILLTEDEMKQLEQSKRESNNSWTMPTNGANRITTALTYLFTDIMARLGVYIRVFEIITEINDQSITLPTFHRNGNHFFRHIIDEEKQLVMWDEHKQTQPFTYDEYCHVKTQCIANCNLQPNSHAFVTSFIDLSRLENRQTERQLSSYVEYSKQLLNTSHSFVIFVDRETYQVFYEQYGKRPNLTWYIIDIDELIDVNAPPPELPQHCSQGKDTYYYMSLIISKTYLVKKAIETNPYSSDYFTWIDVGIAKIINPVEYPVFFEALQRIATPLRRHRIRIPGCYGWDAERYDLDTLYQHKNSPCWYFCGGLFSGHKDTLLIFEEEVKKTVEDMKQRNYITWEVNVWTNVAHRRPELFDIYHANHDISMFHHF